MKNIIKLPAIVLGLMLLLTGTAQRVMAQDEDISLQSFYDELSPYGTWIQDSQYGYVWRPDVEQSDFRPYYSNGRWVMTEYGNTWVSDYDWGWAPFHYGRWVYNRYSQWVWIPDTVWGPAWVSWRSGGGYYGWAPMGPGMNININFNIPDLWWVFVPQRNIYYNNFPRYYSRRNVTIIHNTTIINNVYSRNNRRYYSGPRADDIRRSTRQAVPVYNIDRSSRPGRSSISGNSVEIYRPTGGRSSRGTNAGDVAPRNPVRGEGYATPRSDRSSVDRGNTEGRVSNGRISRDGNPVIDNGRTEGTRGNSRPERGQQRNTSPNERPDRAARQEVQQRQETQPQQQRQERIQAQPRQEIQPREERQSRQEQVRPQPQQRQEPIQQQRQERPQPQPRQEQPRPQPQPQRSERVEQSRPSRGSESRGNSGGGRENNSSSRSSRSGRG